MATVIENDNCRYEVVKVLNPDNQVLNVAITQSLTGNPPTTVDAFGRSRVSNPFTLFDSSHRYSDNGLWATQTNAGGTANFNSTEGLVELAVTTTNASEVIRETFKVFSYQPGKSLLTMSTFVFNPAKSGLRQRVGYFNENNGVFLELNDDLLRIVRRSATSGLPVDTVINQANWNIDKLDGTGPSALTLDISKAQILWMDFEWLGVGSVRVGFMINGRFIPCHILHHANIVTTTYMTTATLPLRYEITNTTATTSISTLKQICSTVISEGGYELRGRSSVINTPITIPYSLTTAGTYYPVLSVRLLASPDRLDAAVVPTGISILGSTNTSNYHWRLIVGGTTTGGTWSTVAGGSPIEFNRTGTSISGGRIVATGFISGSVKGADVLSLSKSDLFKYQLERNGLTATPRELTLAIAASSNNSDAFSSIDFDEVSY